MPVIVVDTCELVWVFTYMGLTYSPARSTNDILTKRMKKGRQQKTSQNIEKVEQLTMHFNLLLFSLCIRMTKKTT